MQILGDYVFHPRPLPMHVRGLSGRLLAACSANGDTFLQYLRNSSDQQLSSFCPRSLSTDSVELAFAEMNASIGYKATAQQLLLHLRRIDIRDCIKKNPIYTFTARVSRRKLYPLHKLEGSFNFNDPAYFSSQKRLNKVCKLAGKKAKGKERTIRSYYNM